MTLTFITALFLPYQRDCGKKKLLNIKIVFFQIKMIVSNMNDTFGYELTYLF